MSGDRLTIEQEHKVLGQPVRLLSDPRLEAATALKAELVAAAIAKIQAAVGEALDAVSIAEVLRYEASRRAAPPPALRVEDEATTLLKMLAVHLKHGRRLGGLMKGQRTAVLEWYELNGGGE